MKLLFVVDARSPIARNWISYFADDYEVTVVSTFSAEPLNNVSRTETIPLLLNQVSSRQGETRKAKVAHSLRGGLASRALSTLRKWLTPIELRNHVGRLRSVINETDCDIVHALRIPYEGIFAAAALSSSTTPLVVSVWGNDFTLHGNSLPLKRPIRRTLARADALLADCDRDVRIALSRGFDDAGNTAVIPGNGGIRRDIFFRPYETSDLRRKNHIASDVPVVINPRGIRDYVRTDTFFRAAAQVLEAEPLTVFLCVDMQANRTAERWVKKLGIADQVRLLPPQTQGQMSELFRMSDVFVSPSEHDGTPNSFLEAITCGVFPVVSELESMREWINDGQNGLFADPADPYSFSHSILNAIRNEHLRLAAADRNALLIRERADYDTCMPAVKAFYERLK